MTEMLPWVKWSFDRWRNEETLRMCGLAARGLWADLLAVMHGCKPYGHLSINGKSPSPKQIASIVGMTTEKEVVQLLHELETNGVFSRSDTGLIYCRRMARKCDGSDEPTEAAKTDRQRRWREQLKAISAQLREAGITPPAGASLETLKRLLVDVQASTEASTEASTVVVSGDGLETGREEKRREEKKDSVLRTDADGAVREPDARDRLWSTGLAALRAMTGMPGGKARGMLGKLVKTARDDCALVLAVLAEAEDARPIDPFPWLHEATLARSDRREGDAERIAREFNFSINDLPSSNPQGTSDARQPRDNSQLAHAIETPDPRHV
jgi:hypothetical protein